MSLSALPIPSIEEHIHGVLVCDPFRWLENRELPQTEEWIQSQHDQCRAYFSKCKSLSPLRSRVEGLLNVDAIDQPARVGDRLFYRRRGKDQEQGCIYVRESPTNRERQLVDPSDHGPYTSVAIHCISGDGSLLAFAQKDSGADTCRLEVVDVVSGRRLPFKTDIGYARGFAFARSNAGFYVCHESPSVAEDHEVRFHSLDQTQADRIIFSRARTPGSRLILIADSVHLGALWIRSLEKTLISDFFVAPLSKDDDWNPVFTNKLLPFSPLLYRGRIFILSYEGAPCGKVVEITIDGLEKRTMVPQGDAPIRRVMIAGDRFVVSRLKNGRTSIEPWTFTGEAEGEIEAPGDGTTEVLPQHAPSETSFFYTYQSFTTPPTIYENSAGQQSAPWSQLSSSPKSANHQVRRFAFDAKDGVQIPITLVQRISAANFQPRPLIMTSYGGFGVLMTPQFSVFVTILLELGAVFALPAIRGGGDYGDRWHEAGRGRNRQTAFDDFIAAAEWLCAEGITSPSKLGIFGGSNSGLLVAAAMTQRPYLFRAVLSIAPLLDMVRYERFDQAAKWQREFGSAKDQDDFHALYAYSPYHHVSETVDYPATLFVTGDSDDRCNPAHVRKMAARLQARAAQKHPIVVDYSKERGHSPVLPLSVRTVALARRLAFFTRELGIEVPWEACDDAASC